MIVIDETSNRWIYVKKTHLISKKMIKIQFKLINRLQNVKKSHIISYKDGGIYYVN